MSTSAKFAVSGGARAAVSSHVFGDLLIARPAASGAVEARSGGFGFGFHAPGFACAGDALAFVHLVPSLCGIAALVEDGAILLFCQFFRVAFFALHGFLNAVMIRVLRCDRFAGRHVWHLVFSFSSVVIHCEITTLLRHSAPAIKCIFFAVQRIPIKKSRERVVEMQVPPTSGVRSHYNEMSIDPLNCAFSAHLEILTFAHESSLCAAFRQIERRGICPDVIFRSIYRVGEPHQSCRLAAREESGFLSVVARRDVCECCFPIFCFKAAYDATFVSSHFVSSHNVLHAHNVSFAGFRVKNYILFVLSVLGFVSGTYVYNSQMKDLGEPLRFLAYLRRAWDAALAKNTRVAQPPSAVRNARKSA